MAWYHEAVAALSAIFFRRRHEAELAEEIRFHLEMEALHREGQGVMPVDATRRAQRAFGGVTRYKDDVRDERGSRGWDQWWRDVSLSWRSLRNRPGFTALVVATLALGIGATSTLFGVVNAVLLSPLPYGNPDGIAVVWSSWRGFPQTWVSWDEYEAWDSDIRSFSDVGLFTDTEITLSEGDVPERVRTGQVGASVFPILGVAPLLGRNFTAEEDRPGGDRVIVLSHTLWERRFGADPSVLGRAIQVDGSSASVIGVMPPGFKLPLDFGSDGATLAWMPLATDAEAEGATPGPAFNGGGGGSHNYYAVARLAPGASIEAANRDLESKVAELRRLNVYSEGQQFRAFAVGVSEQITGRLRPVLLVTFGAVALLLLIACANVAALLLVRGEQRRREMAVRVALGAGPRRLTRLLLTESGVIALLGGAGGVALATVGAAAVRRLAPAAFPRMGETRVDVLVLLFALGATVVTALLAGMLPALQASKVAPAADLKDGGRGATTGGARLRWRQTLVSVEIALAVVIVAGAGLMVRTVRNLLAVDRGFDGRGVLTMQISTPSSWYTDSVSVATFWSELTRRVADLPGVETAGAVRQIPLATEMGDWGLQVEGYTPPANSGTPGDWQVVTPGYFETMGLRLGSGRFLDGRDDMTAPLAMVVNTTFVRTYIGSRSPLGVRVRISQAGPDVPAYTIVGVVDDVRHNGLTRGVKPQFYATLAHFARAPGRTRRSMYLVVRASGAPTALVAPIRRLARALDPRLPISEIRTMDAVIGTAIAEQRFAMQLLSLFGALALSLAAVGVFGVVSQVVEQRNQEFGIRAALGAAPQTLVRMSLATGMRQALVGLAMGLVAALAAAQLLRTMLHGVGASDPLTFAVVALVALASVAMASALPAWRAARRSPASVLFGD